MLPERKLIFWIVYKAVRKIAKKKKIKVSRNKTVELKGVVKKSSDNELKPVVNGTSSGQKQIGSFGGIVFKVSMSGNNKRKILAMNNVKQDVSGEWASHSVIGGKPKQEFTGPGIRTFDFDILIDAQLGYKPHAIMKKLNKMVEKGKVSKLIIGTHKIGTGKWKLEKVSEEFALIYSDGKLMRANTTLTLSEYF